MLELDKYSLGVGDRFAHQAAAQFRAFVQLAELGKRVTPVWNKSNREHSFVGSEPSSVQIAAQRAVQQLDWQTHWHVDADHIQLQTVDRYLDCTDFFTIDVADSIGGTVSDGDVTDFVARHAELVGDISHTEGLP
ncbi:MAG: hypothetical protein KDA93_27760, partial [Planctomycetaceae bacterium]|nr:hypothetical protein [Planctomycetaceae bacterium]